MRKLLAGIVVGAVMVGAPTAIAHHGGTHRGVYRQIDGARFFPNRIVIRCEGFGEDSAHLRLVEYRGDGVPGSNGDTVVYRCVRP